MLSKEKLELVKDELILNITDWIDNKIKECDETVKQLDEALDLFKKGE